MFYIPDIRQIKIFLALEETRSFTAAAEKLNITQSAVSHSMKSLESSLNCQLIERHGKRCFLSPHGEVFLHHATQAFKQLELASQKIHTLNKWGYSSIKIGASNTLCQYLLPEALAHFYKDEKKAEIFITPGDISTLVKQLVAGRLDIAFGLYKKNLETDTTFHPITEDTLCFVTSPQHPWCEKKPTECADFEKERFIIYGNDSVTQTIVNSHLPGIGIRQRATLDIGNMESIKKMTSLGVGVGIISEWIANDELKNKTLIKHAINPPPSRQWGYYLHKSKALSLPEEAFVKSIKEQFEKKIPQGK
ncbi:LysR family transcriptional regulator [Akkermansiaceae bacterium]|nr:LysR family transcriptional regulator [Akkermansiaceae bacterium]